MRDTPAHERPRERLIKVGAASLSEVELLAIIISRGTAGLPVREIAQQLVSQFHSVAEVGRAGVEELMRIPGIGKAKACQIVAAFELARRSDDTPCVRERPELSDPGEVARLARAKVKDWRKECFFTFQLDSRNRCIAEVEVSVGSLDTTLAHPREVFERAIRAGAAGIIVVHNHPSGDPTPSDDDIRLTRRLVEAGKILGIRLLDHVVVCRDGQYSFRAHALL
ncbi:JAB domain-containing protein [candidate division WOR-3 bacterium]|nr:JAB domain-containing protein [candidate division WOR-3 bacterium]